MITVNDLHPQAMDLADMAFRHRRRGDDEMAKRFFMEALELEQQAASLLPPTEESEPSRSVLYRSAASLAYNGGDYETADRLIACGLSGFPPPEIKEELKNLYEDVNFMRHLASKGIVLSKNQWIMTIHGNATSYGGTLAEPLLLRVDKITTLFYRTVERLLRLQYRISGGVSKEIKEMYGLYINTFLPGSFAVAFQVGRPNPQLSLFPDIEQPGIVEPETVIDEVMRCFEILESEEPELLKERFDDENYYENFVGLAKQIAPDGDAVKLVGFRLLKDGEERPIALRKSREQLRAEVYWTDAAEDEKISRVSLRGTLMYASTPRSRKLGTVKLIQMETGNSYTIKVPIAIMKDVVQPYYEERVAITVYQKGKNLFLDEIAPEP